jgi:DNA-binding beta-propeller fold protein YncE
VITRVVVAVAALTCLALAGCSDERASDATTTSRPLGTIAPVPAQLVALDGRPAAVTSTTGSLWVADDERNVVVQLDDADGHQIGKPIPVVDAPTALDASEGVVWVAGATGGVSRIDAATATVIGEPIDVGGVLVDVAVEGDRVWVADIEAGGVRAVDATTGEVGKPIVVTGGAVRLVTGATRLWVSGIERTVTAIDTTTGEPDAPIDIGNAPIGMALDGDVLWVANSDDDTVARLDVRTGRAVGAPIAVGNAPIAVDVEGDDVWVLDQDDQTVTRLRARDGSRVATYALGTRGRGVTAAPGGVWVVGVEPSAAALIKT